MGKGKYYDITEQILKHFPMKLLKNWPISNNPNFLNSDKSLLSNSQP